jgi:hypothetical protein
MLLLGAKAGSGQGDMLYPHALASLRSKERINPCLLGAKNDLSSKRLTRRALK